MGSVQLRTPRHDQLKQRPKLPLRTNMKLVAILALVGACTAATLSRTDELAGPTTTQEPKPYNFGFEVSDDNTTNYQNRAEASDGSGRVKGSYSYVLPDNMVYTITYEDNNDGQGIKMVVRKEPAGLQVVTPEPWLNPTHNQVQV